jgi:hypothetical protein
LKEAFVKNRHLKNRHPVKLCVEEFEGRLVPATLTTSSNWAGYVVDAPTGTVVTDVKGSWVVPAITNTTGAAYSAAWVGIDGDLSNSVEQIGTESDDATAAAQDGTPQYYAWVEMYPFFPYYFVNFPVHPGDHISAEVQVVGSNPGAGGGNFFFLTLTDAPASGPSETINAMGLGTFDQSSAEWIQEAPASGNTILPLANFGKLNFTEAQATIGGQTGPIDNSAWQSGVFQINMVGSRRRTKASTSALTDAADGTSGFSVTWLRTNGPIQTLGTLSSAQEIGSDAGTTGPAAPGDASALVVRSLLAMNLTVTTASPGPSDGVAPAASATTFAHQSNDALLATSGAQRSLDALRIEVDGTGEQDSLPMPAQAVPEAGATTEPPRLDVLARPEPAHTALPLAGDADGKRELLSVSSMETPGELPASLLSVDLAWRLADDESSIGQPDYAAGMVSANWPLAAPHPSPFEPADWPHYLGAGFTLALMFSSGKMVASDDRCAPFSSR